MGELDEALLHDESFHEEEVGPVWKTRDGRVLPMRKMSDEHLRNTINFLRSKGIHTDEDIRKDPAARVEFKLVGSPHNAQEKLEELVAEWNWRQARS